MDKILLIKYYQKTRIFNEDLPIETIKIFKWAIVVHMLMSYYFFGFSTIFAVLDTQGDNFEPINLQVDKIANLLSPQLIAYSLFCIIMFILYLL